MAKDDNRYEFIKKLGVGFDALFKVVDNLSGEYFSENYPPYNIVQTDTKTYVIQVSMVGYELDQIGASHKDCVLSVTAKGSSKPEAEDDVFLHKGIKDGDNYIKFLISKGLKYESAIFDEGILYVTYKVLEENPVEDGVLEIKDGEEVAVENLLPTAGKVKFDRGGKPRLRKRRMGFRKLKYDSAGRPVAVLDADEENVDEEETAALLKDSDTPAPVLSKKEERKAKREERKSAKSTETPIVEVSVPEVAAQIVEAKVVASSEKSVEIELTDATVEVSDDVELKVVKTQKGKSDVVVAIDKKAAVELEEKNVDIVETVKEAVEAAEIVPDVPDIVTEEKTILVNKTEEDKPTVEVTVPEEITSVVAVKADPSPSSNDVPAIVIEDSSEEVSEEAVIVPVITPAGNPDIVAAIEPEVVEKLGEEEATAIVEIAVNKVVKEVATVEPVDEKKVEEASSASVVEEVVETANEEPTVVVVDSKVADKPTVEVIVDIDATEPTPVVVKAEISADVAPEVADVPVIKVTESTIEVSDTAELAIVTTEAEKSDIVVAVEPEVKAEFEKQNVDVVAVVEEAINVAVEAPEIVEPKTATEDIVVIVDKTVEEKPTVEVEVNKEIPQLVKVEVQPPVVVDSAKKDVESIALVPTDHISKEAELIPVVTPEDQPDIVVAVEPEVKAEITKESPKLDIAKVVEKAVNQADVEVVTETPVDTLAVVDAGTEPEVVEKLDAIAKEPATIVVSNLDTTVEVTLAAEESPEIVAVKLDENPSNPEIPAIVVEDATVEVSDTAELIRVETSETAADVVVAIEPEVKAEFEKQNVVVEEVVAKALEVNDAEPEEAFVPTAEPVTIIVDKTVEEKPTVEITVPEMVPSVVALVPKDEEVAIIKDETVPSVEIVPTNNEIPAAAELIPVVTPEGQPDIVVAVTEEAKKELEKDPKVGDIGEILEKAVNQADVEVVATPSVDEIVVEEKAEEASTVEVIEKLDTIAKEPATLIVNETEVDRPTVEVTLAAEENPVILEVTIDENPSNPDVPAIVLEDATVEVSDAENVEVLPVETIETNADTTDTVVVIAPEVKAELEAKNVEIEQVVAKALVTNDAVPVETDVDTDSKELVEVVTDEGEEVTVLVPEEIPQVVEVSVESSDTVEIVEAISVADKDVVELIETAEGEPNVVVVAEKEAVKVLEEESNTTPKEVVEKALEVKEVEIVPSVDIDSEAAPKEEASIPKKPVVVIKKPKT